MSPRKRSGSDTDDLAEAPFLDDGERAEAAWLVARERDPVATPPSQKVANDYTELEQMLAELPAGPPDDSWHDAVLKMTRSRPLPLPWWRRTAVRWAAGGALVAAAAVAVLLLLPRAPLELEVAIRHVKATRGDHAAVGDRLVVMARPHGIGDLRVYRSDGPLVARCPGGPGCRTAAAGEYIIETTLEAPVQHHVILVVGMHEAVPAATMDGYIVAARAANARIVMVQPIDVD